MLYKNKNVKLSFLVNNHTFFNYVIIFFKVGIKLIKMIIKKVIDYTIL